MRLFVALGRRLRGAILRETFVDKAYVFRGSYAKRSANLMSSVHELIRV